MLVLLFLSTTRTEEETEALRTIIQPDLTVPQTTLKVPRHTLNQHPCLPQPQFAGYYQTQDYRTDVFIFKQTYLFL